MAARSPRGGLPGVNALKAHGPTSRIAWVWRIGFAADERRARAVRRHADGAGAARHGEHR